MKKLVAELMNHGFSEHQAQEFLQRCYGIFENILAKRVITELNNGLVNEVADYCANDVRVITELNNGLVNGTEEPKE